MEMLQLRYFYDSAMSESFSKTAKKYMVPVSSVSASVKRLEQELGMELFFRTGNRITLNAKGQQFLSVVSNSLSQLDMGVRALSAELAQNQTLSILVRCTRQNIVRKIMDFHKLYPSVSFKITFDDTPENFDTYDIIVSTPHNALVDYESLLLKQYIVRIEALESDPICQRTVTLSQLRDRQFVTSHTQRGSFALLTQACQKLGFKPKVFLECDDYTCRDMVVTSGAALGLTLCKNYNSGRGNLRYLTVTDFNEQISSYVYYKNEAYNGNIKLFIDMVKATL